MISHLKPIPPMDEPGGWNVLINRLHIQKSSLVIRPTASRKYTIESKGASDSVLTLFEDIDGVPRFLAGDDDSGTERKAAITQKLFEGRNYVARLRVVYPGQTGTTSLLLS